MTRWFFAGLIAALGIAACSSSPEIYDLDSGSGGSAGAAGADAGDAD